MSQEKFDAIDPKTLTETAQTIYKKERARRGDDQRHQSFPEKIPPGNKLAPSEIIDFIKTELGPEYDIWLKKQRIIIRKSSRVGCSFPITMDENGYFSYGKRSAFYSSGYSFLVSIPFIIIMFLILLFLANGIFIFIAIGIPLRFIIKFLASIPSKEIINKVDEILKSKECMKLGDDYNNNL